MSTQVIDIDGQAYEFRSEGSLYGLYEVEKEPFEYGPVEPGIIPAHWGDERLPEYLIRVLDDSGDTTYIDSTWRTHALAEARLRIVDAQCAGCWIEEY